MFDNEIIGFMTVEKDSLMSEVIAFASEKILMLAVLPCKAISFSHRLLRSLTDGTFRVGRALLAGLT